MSLNTARAFPHSLTARRTRTTAATLVARAPRPEDRWKDIDSETLFKEYRETREERLRDVLVGRYTQLVAYLANKFANRGEPVEDLRQIAFIGLLKAIERFDPAAGAKFITYATPTIVGEIKRHFRDKGWMLKVPRRLQETHLALNRVSEHLTRQLGRAPLPAELAKELDVPVELVLEAQELGQNYSMLSLDVQSGNEDADKAASLTEFLGEHEPGFERAEAHAAIKAALSTLSRQEQIVVYLSFYGNQTQVQIAKRIGVSQMQVSRILHKALGTLKKTMTSAPAGS
jgi:RNA polymerase sigma-B factor